MDNDPRRALLPSENIVRANNAIVEEAVCFSNATGYLVISYRAPGASQNASLTRVRLNVDRNTILLNALGRTVSLCGIRTGMRVNAVFSSRMTRSIPPQANAFLITVRRSERQETNEMAGRIASVDLRNHAVTVGTINDVSDQIRFVVNENTTITDRMGRNLSIRQLRPGQLVRVTYANFQTASIPPQTVAFQIELI